VTKLTAHALIQPHGPLTTTLFPGRDVNGLGVLVDGWLDVSYAHEDVVAEGDETTQNKMAKAYALYLAYTDVYRRMLAEPNAVARSGDDKGSSSYTDKQRDDMKAIAASYLDEFLSLVPTAAADAVTPGTVTVPIRLVW